MDKTFFQESQTLQNLMLAFAGESQARNRYTFAAALCGKQNFHVLDAVFTFTANQEKEHAQIFYNHMKAVSGRQVHISGDYPVNLSHDALDLLRMARDSEFEESGALYPSFGDTARQEGFPEIADSFERIARIEQSHGNRFARYMDLLGGGGLYVSDTEQGWLCLNCGHIHQGTEAPKSCPVCGHPQGFFLRLEAAPYGGPGVLFPMQ
ncbi:MAG: rubrerythrin family protein [Oscillibacter sp.]|nr:rubrerythrin family protein [Oscillibacter sp.]